MCPEEKSKTFDFFRCPFEAIDIINIPNSLNQETTHRYGANAFKLHGVPMPRAGLVLGLVGTNGIGKSTALRILANKLKPNLGKFEHPPDWSEIIRHFRGSEMQNFLTKMLENDLKAITKPQHVDLIASTIVNGIVSDMLKKKDERKMQEHYTHELELQPILGRNIRDLSGGELQRFALAMVCIQQADVYLMDEPSSFLDIKQRLVAAKAIRALCTSENYCVVVEHDLSVLDYLSDQICCFYGKPGAYGVVTLPFSVREGINVFLQGYLPTENMRFRDEELTFKICQTMPQYATITAANHDAKRQYSWPIMEKTLGTFTLHVEQGSILASETIVLLGQNGCGKTTFIRALALEHQLFNVSYKPQMLARKFPGTVRQLLHTKIRGTYTNPQFDTDVMRPLHIASLMDQDVNNLSGGELQRVAITLCLGKPADVYLLDEPSAFLDSEQRIVCAKVLKRFVSHNQKTAFVVEHDFIMASYLADRVIVYDGTPSVQCTAHAPESLLSGMNRFLKEIDVTFRRDPSNYRPRINKHLSMKDQEQKAAGTYFYLDTENDRDDDIVNDCATNQKKKI